MSDTLPSEPAPVVIEICGEGKTDVSKQDSDPVLATEGVIPVLVRRLCENPPTLRVKRIPYMFLQGKGRWQKVRGAKRNAKINGSAGCVFVLDSEGDLPSVTEELERGRSSELPEYPMAVGIAHPCIEAWLLSDASALRQGLGISGTRPVVPTQPESLSAPHEDRGHNPKTVLDALHPKRKNVNAVEKTTIVELLDIAAAETICPSFGSFASEIRTNILDRLMELLFPPRPPNQEPDTIPPT